MAEPKRRSNLDPPVPETVAAPTAEDYQKLLSEVSELREYVQSNEKTFRDDIIRERRRREQIEDEIQVEIQKLGQEGPRNSYYSSPPTSFRAVDEEAGERRALSNHPLKSPLRGLKNKLSFSGRSSSRRGLTSSFRSNRSDSDPLNGDVPPQPPFGDPDQFEGTDIPLLPHDTFSFLAYSKLNSIPLFLSVFVVGVQVVTLTVLVIDLYGDGEPGNILGIPKGINENTAIIQVVAIFIMTASQTDLHDSLNTLYIGYEAYDLSEALDTPVPKWRWSVSLWVRVVITLYAIGATFIMIITEPDTTEVLLDFTAIEFITQLDNIFFWLCAYGYVGFGAQKDATLVLNAKPFSIIIPRSQDENATDPERSSILIRTKGTKVGMHQERSRTFPRFLFTSCLFFLMMAVWGTVFSWIRQGEFLCQRVFVQFTDDATADLAPFTGIYANGCLGDSDCRRVDYVEARRGMQSSKYSKTAKFDYCVEKASWGFVYGNDTGDVLAGKVNPCYPSAHSKDVSPKTQDSYDIISTASDQWKVLNRLEIDVPFEGFELRCADCQYDSTICGAPTRGECKENRCVCHDGWYGRRCEFNTPCEKIEFTNPELDTVDGRKFATTYHKMYQDNGVDPIEIYDRPVYEGFLDDGAVGEIGSSNQVFFNGLRWVLVTDLGTTLKSSDFHGYWSAKSEEYTVEFYSAAVRVDSPEDSASPDGLSWYFTKPKQFNRNVQGVDLTSEAPFKFLCANCNNETNPCLYGGICQKDGTTPGSTACECSNSGSSGRLCQILPTGNGRCDTYFNNREYAWDGGDCCQETCVSSDEHICGRGTVFNSQGVAGTGYIGYDNCKDPSVVVSGSRTINDIKQRGVLQCGVILSTAWFYNFMADQCRAIAAAVLDNPNAIQLVNFTDDRFTGLRDKEFDIVFRTDHTANRDVYEVSARSGFSFATVPYYYGGFVFAGIKPFGKCANDGDFFSVQCLNLKICLQGGTTWFDAASKVFPSRSIVTYDAFESTVAGLENNECNVIGGLQVDVDLISVREFGFTGDPENYEVGTKVYFKSFQTWMTRETDRLWSRFTSWVFESLVQAEESNITQATSDLMGTANVFSEVFGVEFNNTFKKAVAAVGNYGEMWERNMPFTRSGMNLVNNGSNGAMVSFDFGRVSDTGPEPSGSSSIRAILARNTLRCAITSRALGFSEYNENTNLWSGLAIDVCRGIAAALFGGDDSKMAVIEVTSADRFSKLDESEVDIVLGATRTLEREFKVGRTNFAFDFSPVYFHDGMIFAGEMPYAACAENQEFTNVNTLGLDCTGTKICVSGFTTWFDTVVKVLGIGEENLLLTTNFEQSMQSHKSGLCNVIVGESGRLNQLSLEEIGYSITENYYIGTTRFTKEPLCLMHRSDDPQFSDFVRWIVFGYFYAEEKGITTVNHFNMPETNLFGAGFTKMFQNAIRSVGSYAEIYGRNLGEGFPPRSGLNLLNDLSSPNLFAAPGTVGV